MLEQRHCGWEWVVKFYNFFANARSIFFFLRFLQLYEELNSFTKIIFQIKCKSLEHFINVIFLWRCLFKVSTAKLSKLLKTRRLCKKLYIIRSVNNFLRFLCFHKFHFSFMLGFKHPDVLIIIIEKIHLPLLFSCCFTWE